jgi:hypothetical protein
MRTERSSKSPTKELSEQLLRRHLFLESPASSGEATTAEPSRTSTPSSWRLESCIWIAAVGIELFLLVRIAQHLKCLADHLERIVCTVVAVLVRVRK